MICFHGIMVPALTSICSANLMAHGNYNMKWQKHLITDQKSQIRIHLLLCKVKWLSLPLAPPLGRLAIGWQGLEVEVESFILLLPLRVIVAVCH